MHVESDAAIRFDRGTVARDRDREVTAFAHERTGPAADAVGGPAVVAEARRQVELRTHCPRVGREPADQNSAG
jgi:hypothetical protein